MSANPIPRELQGKFTETLRNNENNEMLALFSD